MNLRAPCSDKALYGPVAAKEQRSRESPASGVSAGAAARRGSLRPPRRAPPPDPPPVLATAAAAFVRAGEGPAAAANPAVTPAPAPLPQRLRGARRRGRPREARLGSGPHRTVMSP